MLKLIKIIVFLLFVQVSFAQSPLLNIMAGDGITYEDETLAYIARVEADGGVVINVDLLNEFIKDAKDKGYYDSLLTTEDANWGVKKNSNNKVTKLYDIKGILDYVQTDTSKSPTWVANSILGFAGLKFDGSNDYLHCDIDTLISNQPDTYILALKNNVDNSNKMYCDVANSAGRQLVAQGSSNKTILYGGAVVTDTMTVVLSKDYIVSGVYNGANSQIYQNNVLKMTGDAGADFLGGGGSTYSLIIGAASSSSQFGGFTLYTHIIKKGIGNISNINTFINSKYNIY